MSGLQALSTALTNADNKSLTILNLWECSFTEGAARTVTTSLAGRRALSVEEGSASLDTVRAPITTSGLHTLPWSNAPWCVQALQMGAQLRNAKGFEFAGQVGMGVCKRGGG